MTDATSLTTVELKRLLGDALQRPAQEGARLVALHWLQQLSEARRGWSAGDESVVGDGEQTASGDTDLLHRARVALRRLRAVLREHESALDGAIDRRTARSLRALGQATNVARDMDVQRTWLSAEAEGLAPQAREEAQRLLARIDRRRARRGNDVGAAFAEHFDPIAERLFQALSSYRLLQRVGSATTPAPFARHLATRIERAATRIRRDLESVHSVSSRDEIHRVRIRLKRQRAMLAPFAKSSPALAAWFELATRGQDQLGAIRDADLLADRAAKLELPALASALHAVALGHYEAFSRAWCERPEAVIATIDAAVTELRAAGTPRSASGLPMEIERKYLLTACPPPALSAAPIHIEQGWIPGTAVRERLRRSTLPGGEIKLRRTVKLGGGTARVEIEEDMPPTLFNALWPLTQDARIRKHRHVVREGSHAWEIDVFLDRDLVLAEVELESTEDNAAIPTWLAPYIVRDVTGEPQYFNAVLARPDRS